MRTKKSYLRKWLAFPIFLCLSTYVQAQSAPAQNPTRDNVDPSRSVPDRDINRTELAQFDQFLGAHPEIAEQLRKDPSLANNREFVKNHPALQTYLHDHPQTRDALKDDPNTFMSAENRFDRNEASRGESANFDRFLDAHREIATQLRKNPSLLDNQQYLKDHPELQSYLQDHPAIRQQIKENPSASTQQEDSYHRFEDSRNRDSDRRELANFDQFLDSHREISEQLRKQPTLVDNKQFLKDHPALQSYLQQHPAVREQRAQNPNAFMDQEAHYERSGEDRNMDRNSAYDRDRDNNDAYDRNRDDRNRDMDRDRDAQKHFGEFLGSHQDIAEQLSKNPSLAKDHDYLQNHRELQEYLNSHPEVRQPLTSDPDSFMKSTQQFNNSGQAGKIPAAPTSTTQPKPNKQ